MKRLLISLLAMVALSGFCLPGRAAADSVVYSLDIANHDTLSNAAVGPFVTLTVNLTATGTATLTFQSLTQTVTTPSCPTGCATYYVLGGQDAVTFSVNGGYTLGAITASNSLGTQIPGWTKTGPYTSITPSNNDGFGVFDQGIHSFDGPQRSATSISVALSGGSWTSASQVLEANVNGYYAGAHIYPQDTCDGNVASCLGSDIGSGYVAGNAPEQAPPNPTPEPATMLLTGSLLAGLGVAGRRKFLRIIRN